MFIVLLRNSKDSYFYNMCKNKGVFCQIMTDQLVQGC